MEILAMQVSLRAERGNLIRNMRLYFMGLLHSVRNDSVEFNFPTNKLGTVLIFFIERVQLSPIFFKYGIRCFKILAQIELFCDERFHSRTDVDPVRAGRCARRAGPADTQAAFSREFGCCDSGLDVVSVPFGIHECPHEVGNFDFLRTCRYA